MSLTERVASAGPARWLGGITLIVVGLLMLTHNAIANGDVILALDAVVIGVLLLIGL